MSMKYLSNSTFGTSLTSDKCARKARQKESVGILGICDPDWKLDTLYKYDNCFFKDLMEKTKF